MYLFYTISRTTTSFLRSSRLLSSNNLIAGRSARLGCQNEQHSVQIRISPASAFPAILRGRLSRSRAAPRETNRNRGEQDRAAERNWPGGVHSPLYRVTRTQGTVVAERYVAVSARSPPSCNRILTRELRQFPSKYLVVVVTTCANSRTTSRVQLRATSRAAAVNSNRGERVDLRV